MTRRQAGWLVLLVAFVVCVLGGFQYWRTHDTVLNPYAYGLQPAPVPAGTTLYADIYVGNEPQTVKIDDVEPDLARRTVQTDVGYVLCHGGEPNNVAVGLDELEEICDRVEPAIGKTVTFGDDDKTSLMVAITSETTGAVEVHGYRIDYSTGWRSGHRAVGVVTIVRFR